MLLLNSLWRTPPALKRAAEEWLVAATVATEVPANDINNQYSSATFTKTMIDPSIRAVCEVIRNRTEHSSFPNSALEVVLQPVQFSAVMRGLSTAALGHRDIWRDAVAGEWAPEHVERCLRMWRTVRDTSVQLVPGVLWYYSPVSMRPPHREPTWAASKHEVIVPNIAVDYFRWYKP